MAEAKALSALAVAGEVGATAESGSGSRIPRCCCGRSQKECPFLASNNTTLDGLERDVQTAARLGQALLIRHESYIADSERERTDMSASIEKLEIEKRELEQANARTIEENRALLDELEKANSAVASSDAHVQALATTLQSTRREVQHLTLLASRAEELERQLVRLEIEEVELHDALEGSRAETKNVAQRWKRAEQTIADLQDQLDRIEREGREEKERRGDIAGRIGRSNIVERDDKLAVGMRMGSGTGNVDGGVEPAALKGHSEKGSDVVSQFVTDILHDNANLQEGIVELRQMLLNSNFEIENLREQLMQHQPVYGDCNDEGTRNCSDQFATVSESLKVPTLEKDLTPTSAPASASAQSPALHIHHHYHVQSPAQSSAKKANRPHVRSKPCRTSTVINKEHQFSTPPASPTPLITAPRGNVQQRPIAKLSTKRESTTSTNTLLSGVTTSLSSSSAPSSPYSVRRASSSIFERASGNGYVAGGGETFPTTPDSSAIGSPLSLITPGIDEGGTMDLASTVRWQPERDRSVSMSSMKRNCPPRPTSGAQLQAGAIMSPSVATADKEQWQEGSESMTKRATTPSHERTESPSTTTDDNSETPTRYRRAHKRVSSVASLASFISVSGMDIHTHSDTYSQTHTYGPSTPTKPSSLTDSVPSAWITEGETFNRGNTDTRPRSLRPHPSTLFLSRPSASVTATTTTTAAAALRSASDEDGLSHTTEQRHGRGHAVLSGLVSSMNGSRVGRDKAVDKGVANNSYNNNKTATSKATSSKMNDARSDSNTNNKSLSSYPLPFLRSRPSLRQDTVSSVTVAVAARATTTLAPPLPSPFPPLPSSRTSNHTSLGKPNIPSASTKPGPQASKTPARTRTTTGLVSLPIPTSTPAPAPTPVRAHTFAPTSTPSSQPRPRKSMPRMRPTGVNQVGQVSWLGLVDSITSGSGSGDGDGHIPTGTTHTRTHARPGGIDGTVMGTEMATAAERKHVVPKVVVKDDADRSLAMSGRQAGAEPAAEPGPGPAIKPGPGKSGSRAGVRVIAEAIDEEALRECLDSG